MGKCSDQVRSFESHAGIGTRSLPKHWLHFGSLLRLLFQLRRAASKAEHSGSAYRAILSYTYSHSLDDKSSEAGINGDTSGNGPQNEYDFNADYSSSSFDITHSFVGSVTADFPFGKGRRFLAGSSRALDP